MVECVSRDLVCSSGEKAIGFGVKLGHLAKKTIGVKGINFVIHSAEQISKTTLPKWNNSIPSSSRIRTERSVSADEVQFIYFPSCISRQLGVPSAKYQVSGSPKQTLGEVFINLAHRANINLHIPENVTGHCCGMPFASKGYNQAAQLALHQTLTQMWEWSEHGKYPVVIDTTSCTHTLRTCSDDLSEEDKEIWKHLNILDGIEFLNDYVLPKLKLQPVDDEVILHPNCSAPKLELNPVDDEVILHPNCSARKLGLDTKMLSIAEQCAKSAVVPLNLGCCAFAGDRGLLFPELTKSATERETAEVLEKEYDGYYSSNITCEIGMSEATGKNYTSVVYLVERASRA